MSKLGKLVQELRDMLEDDGGGAGGVGTGTAPSASGVTMGGAPAGGAPGSIYMGGSMPMPGSDQSGMSHPRCAGCGKVLYGSGPCASCYPFGGPLRAIGVPVGSFPKKKHKKKHKKKAKKA